MQFVTCLLRRRILDADRYQPALGGEFDRVGEQIVDDLTKLVGIGVGRSRCGHVDLQFQAFVLDQGGHHVTLRLHQSSQIDVARFDLHLACLNLGQIKNVIDHFQ